MKYFISLLLLAFFTTSASGQSLERQVVGSMGIATQTNNAGLSQTVGQIATKSAHLGSVVLSQGFQQSNIGSTTGTHTTDPLIELTIYPNPTHERLNVSSNLVEYGIAEIHFAVYDMHGRLNSEGQLFTTGGNIEVSHLQPATYTLVLTDAKGKFSSVSRFIKM